MKSQIGTLMSYQITRSPPNLALIGLIDEMNALSIPKHQIELIAPKPTSTSLAHLFIKQLNAVHSIKRNPVTQQRYRANQWFNQASFGNPIRTSLASPSITVTRLSLNTVRAHIITMGTSISTSQNGSC